MSNLLLISATGTIGQATPQALLGTNEHILTVAARHATKHYQLSDRIRVLDLDATDSDAVAKALEGQDAVFVTVSGQLVAIAKSVVAAMKRIGVPRLVFVAAMGIENEIPAAIPYDNLDHNPLLKPYREAANIVATSGLDYTILRPGLFSDGRVNYAITHSGEPFGGLKVSIASVADVAKRALLYDEFSKESIGIHTLHVTP